nr:hypothetical protein [Planctomycetota bacterium]
MATAAHRGCPSRASEPPRLLLPLGIPTYSLRHGFYVWKAGTKPVTQLYPDWDIFWVRSGEASWEFADGRRLSAGPDEFIILPPSTPAVVSQSRPSMTFWFCHFGFRQAPSHIAEEWQPDFSGSAAPAAVPMRFSRREAPEVWKAYRDLTRLDASASVAGPHSWRLERALIVLIAHLAAFA